MARIVWSRPARDDLKEVVSYIKADSPAYAKSFALRLHQRLARLELFPDGDRLVPEDYTNSYRELLFKSYRIIYRQQDDTVAIVAVIHGARMLRL